MTQQERLSSLPAAEPYAFQTHHPRIGRTIGFRPATLEQDLDRLHEWQHQPHVVPYWNLNWPRERYKAHLEAFLADKHQTLYIGSLDGEPMSYFESYWTKDDIIGRHYDAHPADQGVHLLIGPPSFLQKGYALPLLESMVFFQFMKPETEKIIAEPDVRNAKMIHIFEKCGFTFQKEVDLPDKTGALMFCRREDFDRRWNHG